MTIVINATIIFCAIAFALFVMSCVFYKFNRKIAGDRFLFLAYGLLACGWITVFERWRLI